MTIFVKITFLSEVCKLILILIIIFDDVIKKNTDVSTITIQNARNVSNQYERIIFNNKKRKRYVLNFVTKQKFKRKAIFPKS